MMAMSFLLILPFLVLSSAQLLLPSIDPFYQPSAGFASTPPGTILKTRKIIAAAVAVFPDPVEAYQLLYRTRSINGSAIATVTTIIKPPKSNGTQRIISFQSAEDSSNFNSAVSYNLQFANPPTDVIVEFESLFIQGYLSLGYIVVAPDYEGPDAAFSAGRLEGYAVLDSMRAALKFLDQTQQSPIVGAGYSGGAIATGWAAALQSSYAPELPIKGWTMGGTPANLTGTLVFLDGTTFAGFLPAAVNGLNRPSTFGSQINSIIQRIATPYGLSVLEEFNHIGPAGEILTFAGKRVLSYDFQSLGSNLPYEPTIAQVLGLNILGVKQSETPIAPVLLYHASSDEIIPYANASTLFNSWCNYGASVHFTTYGSGGHATTEIVGFVQAAQYADAFFSQQQSGGCAADTVLNPEMNPLALGLEAEPILINLLTKLLDFGPNDTNIIEDVESGNFPSTLQTSN